MKLLRWLPLAIAPLSFGCGHRSTPPHSLEIGIWYWHSPFSISKDERKLLDHMGVSTLYVRAATFTTDGVRASTMMPEMWSSNSGGLPVVLVFNFDGGLDSHFGSLTNPPLADQIAAGIDKEWTRASKQVAVAGVQMDIDCPTRLLPKYADLLQQIRSKLSRRLKGKSFSATALQTWLTSPSGYQRVADACDFLCPQFYEGRIGKTIDAVQPVADLGALTKGLQKADQAGKPFYVGIATYGHSLIYNPRGQLQGMYHGIGPEDALRHPSLKMEYERPITGGQEELLMLKAVKPDQNGRGLGSHIAYVIPTADSLKTQIETLKANLPANCQGLILYRYPGENDEFALPLRTVADVLQGKQPALDIKIKLNQRSEPWSMIGTGKHGKSAPQSFQVRLGSHGSSPTRATQGAVQLLMRFDKEGLDAVAQGDFDSVTVGREDQGNFQPCALAHANAVLFQRSLLLPGQKLSTGEVSTPIDGPNLLRVQWKARAPSGVSDVSGMLDSKDLRLQGGGSR
ncbi:MAG TPA: DUF3142 domain-containing protein [Fimbriimonas sp.]|nr:DUF3142 domain-containing protein [Fimbriimonas sp.]